MDKNIDHLFSLLIQVSHQMGEYINRYARSKGLTMPRLATLKYINEEGSPTMKEIADCLCITTASATSLINGLVKTNEVRRITDKDDRRLVRLVITKRGKKNLDKNLHEIGRYLKNFLNKLPRQDHQNLIKILEKIIKFYN